MLSLMFVKPRKVCSYTIEMLWNVKLGDEPVGGQTQALGSVFASSLWRA